LRFGEQNRRQTLRIVVNKGDFGFFYLALSVENSRLRHARLGMTTLKVKISFKNAGFGLRQGKIPSILQAYGKTINQITNHWRCG
jgi:hypothetical protein